MNSHDYDLDLFEILVDTSAAKMKADPDTSFVVEKRFGIGTVKIFHNSVGEAIYLNDELSSYDAVAAKIELEANRFQEHLNECQWWQSLWDE